MFSISSPHSFVSVLKTPSLFLLLSLLLQHLLDDLLLLDQEGADDAVLDAVGAPRATVRAADGLLGLRDLGVLAGSEGGDLWRAGLVVMLKALEEARWQG